MFVIKTKTENGRLAKTRIFMPQSDIVVIDRRLLIKKEDIEDKRFGGYKPIYVFKEYILVENQMVFFTDSFNAIQEAFKELNEQWQH